VRIGDDDTFCNWEKFRLRLWTPVYINPRAGGIQRRGSGFPRLVVSAYNGVVMGKAKVDTFQVPCPDCGAMILLDATTGLVISHTSAPRKRMFEDLETAAKAMREQDERKESLFRQSVDAEKNKEDLFDKKFAEALKKAKDAPAGKPLREFDLD
jgi:hypothetical protein